MLDATDQVLQRRMVLVDHRARAVGRMLDQQVDQIALHRERARIGGGLDIALGVRRLAQRFAAGDDVGQHRVEEGTDLGQVGVFRPQVVDQVGHGHLQRLAAGLLEPGLQLAPPARELAHQLVHALVQRLDLGGEFGLALGRQLLELVLRQRRLVVFLERHEGEAVRRLEQRHAMLHRFVAQRLHRGELALLFLLLHRLDPAAVFLALEHRADRRRQFLDQMLHVVAQRRAATAGQAQQLGLARIGEVVDIAPVRRRLARAALALEQLVDDRVAAAAGLAQQVDVVAVMPDVEPELDRFERAFVYQGGVEFGQFGAARNAQCSRVAAGVEGFGRQRFRQGHGLSSARHHASSRSAAVSG